MPIREDLINAIENVVSNAATAGYSDASATNDIYENYILALCLAAARQHGAVITYEDYNEQPAQSLVFRTTPGAIYSTAHLYTHAAIQFPGCPTLEAHVGIRVTGKSRVLHECDIAVLDKEEARLCRANQVHPRASKVILAAECKFYTSAIQLYLGRSFLGLTSDIHRKERYFVTNGQSPSVTKLIAHHQSEWECGVLPNSPDADALLHSFARAFRNYRASFLAAIRLGRCLRRCRFSALAIILPRATGTALPICRAVCVSGTSFPGPNS